MKGTDTMKTLLTTTALLSIFLAGPALATPLVDSHDQNALQTQISAMQQMQKQLAASIARAKAQAAAGAAASGGDAKATGGDADAGNANPQSLNSEGDRTDVDALSFSYVDSPLPAFPVITPGAINMPQDAEATKLGFGLYAKQRIRPVKCTLSYGIARDRFVTLANGGERFIEAAASAQVDFSVEAAKAVTACKED
jgi:hypothetical protein